ncbi:hypothetical protein HU200_033042 [Digitaria exilis]|uniref:F-box associated beta-propeller type 3 domain-containing protein n=1 Tax=Digitaria exilis TaxID=1010633 RepID=A0A835ENE4_9POAL|nr:hypothetical protein HU200_033042 [Digitaria exilis]
MRSLAGLRYHDLKYVNTCNGVVLLARNSTYNSASCRCVLWNPAIADALEEVIVPCPNLASEYSVLGLGYGQRSKAYKLLLLMWRTARNRTRCTFASLQLGGGDKKEPTELRDCDGSLQEGSLYIDGKIYLLNKSNSVIVAFDVDEERFTSINVPVEDAAKIGNLYVMSRLMEMSGRPCLLSYHSGNCTFTLWVLSRDHRLGQRFFIRESRHPQCPVSYMYLYSIKGVWDCGGVLVLYLQDINENNLYLYNVMTEKMFKAKMDKDMTPPPLVSGFSDCTLCWGYRPTLVSPSSIIGKLNRDNNEQSRECSRGIMKALKPIVEQDRRKGQEPTLHIVCFMDFLVRIMQKLPKELQQVLDMTMIDSDDPDFSFQNVPVA